MDDSAQNLQTLIDDIRQFRERDHQHELSSLKVIDNLLGQVSENLYSTEFHFILELIQNAVDSPCRPDGLVQVQFHLNKQAKSLIVANNGAPFSETDLKRLCGDAQKRKGPKKIGYKGIGFKSVVRITHNPQIYSPGCQFEFAKKHYPGYEHAWLIIPHSIPRERAYNYIQSDLVTFVLPFREDLSADEIDRLSREMDELPPELLLFLDNLEKLTIRNEYSHHAVDIRKRVNEAGLTIVERAKVLPEAAEWQPLGRWLVTSHQPQQRISEKALDDYETKRGLKKRREAGEEVTAAGDTKIALAFRLNESDNFLAEENGPIFAFFPVIGQTSGLRFCVQADFLTTANRESLITPSPWNEWLLSNLPDVIKAGIAALKQQPECRSIIYNALPLEDEGQKLFKDVVVELLPQLRCSPLIITDLPGDETWLLPAEVVWLPPGLRPLLNNADLPHLWPEKRAFVSFNIEGERAEKFLTSSKGLQVDKIYKEKFLEFLENTTWLEEKPVAWFGPLFDYLAASKLNDEQQRKLGALKLIPTETGLARPNEGIFLPAKSAPLSVPLARFVHPGLLTQLDPKAIDFLAELGVARVTPAGLIEKVIIPTCKEQQDKLPVEILAEYVAFVKAYYNDLSNSLRDKLRPLMRLEAGDGSWQPVCQLSLAVDLQGRQTLAGYLLAGAPGRFLAHTPDGHEQEAWVDFCLWLGLKTEPPAASLLDALKETAWFAGKPAEWFCVLYTYLAPYAKTSVVLRDLSTIPVIQADGATQLRPPSNRIYFQTDDAALRQWAHLFAEDDLTFVNPAILSPVAAASAPFPADPVQVRHFLENLGITELKPHEIIKRLIIPRFEECAAKNQYSDRLLDYTAFVFETFRDQQNRNTSEVWQKFKEVVELKATDGSWSRPNYIYKTYLTKAYGAHDFETLLGGSLLKSLFWVRFLSADYLSLRADQETSTTEHRKQWHEFMVELGAHNKLTVNVSQGCKNFYRDFDRSSSDWSLYRRYLHSIMETANRPSLIDYERYGISNHATMDWLKEIIEQKDTNRFEVLINLMGDFWDGETGYHKKMVVNYYFEWHRSQHYQEKPSFIAWLLTSHPIIPTNRGLKSSSDSDPVYRNIPEIRRLVGNEAAYLNFKAKENQKELLAGLLGVVWTADSVPVEAVKQNLRQLKATATASPKQCAEIYKFLADKNEFDLLEQGDLVYLPTASRQWWRPSQLFWANHHKLFGNLRGYVSEEAVYKDYYSTFEKIGVNTGDPRPKDWTDLLLEVDRVDDSTKQVIWKAYQELATFWRNEQDEAPEWWSKFATSAKLKLLTESKGYCSLVEGIYIPDDPERHKLFKEALPFIWLRDNYRTVETLLNELGLRRISDPRWVKAEINPGVVVEPEKAAIIRHEIVEARPFIRSILVHKHPQAETDFNPMLERLNHDSNFKVCLVDSLTVELIVTEHPEIRRPLKRNAFYAAELETLYVLSSIDQKAIGLGVATMFGEFEEDIRSELRQLFAEPSQKAKEQLLDDLYIPLCEPLPPTPELVVELPPPIQAAPPPPLTTTGEIFEVSQKVESELPRPIDSQSSWPPQYQPEDARVKVEEFKPSESPKRQRRSNTGSVAGYEHQPPSSSSPPSTEVEDKLSTEDKDKIGQLGEELARKGIKDELCKKYPTGEITETSNSFTITHNGQIVAKAAWLTKDQGEQAGYDFCVVENGISTYYEVKSTIMEAKEWFDVSRKQWEFAQEQGEQFFILRVYNVGAENVKVEKIGNPYKLWQEGSLTAYPVRIQI